MYSYFLNKMCYLHTAVKIYNRSIILWYWSFVLSQIHNNDTFKNKYCAPCGIVYIVLYLIHYQLCVLCTYYYHILLYATLYKRHAYCRQLIIYELLLFSCYCNLYYKWFMSMELTARGTRHVIFDVYFKPFSWRLVITAVVVIA